MTKFFSRDRDFYKRYILLTLTIAAQNVITQLVNLADSVMLGAYSETALSGVALVNQIQFLLQMLVIGAGEGIVVLAARSWGRGEIDPIRRISGVGMMIGMGMTTLLWGAVFFFPYGVLRLLTPETAVIEQGVIYLQIVCFTYFFFAVTQILLASMRSVETARIGLFVSVAALVINIFFNYVLIFGKLGFPALG
ncbi:MAG: MATE family efflux transporter, partial [Clostridia bacterium]|nr:MATE family efflux transporter [Clostridia bacterium]